jgi:hypothetical protein
MAAVVGDDRTGRKVAACVPSADQNFYGVTAAADDRTLVVMNYEANQQETTWYLLRLTPGAAHPTRLTKLPMPPLAAHVNGLALSPDGRELAVMWRSATTETNEVTHLLVYSMASGAVLHAWTTKAVNDNSLGGNANSEGLSWPGRAAADHHDGHPYYLQLALRLLAHRRERNRRLRAGRRERRLGGRGLSRGAAGVRRTRLTRGTSATRAHGTDARAAVPASVAVTPIDDDSGPMTSQPTGMMTREANQS